MDAFLESNRYQEFLNRLNQPELLVIERSTVSKEIEKPESYEHRRHKSCDCPKHKKNKKTCGCTRKLTKHSFKCGKKGFVISKPGKYCLVDNIKYNPEKVGDLITIDANNVILNLCGNSISQVNNLDQVNGIRIISGRTNVTIEGGNGSIKGFSTFGIRAEAGFENVTISNVVVSECGVSNPTKYGFLHNACGGLWLGDSPFGYINNNFNLVSKNLSLLNVISTKNNLSGISIMSCENVDVVNCTINDNVGLKDFSGDSICIALNMINLPGLESRCKNVTILNSSITNNKTLSQGESPTDLCFGGYLTISGFLIKDSSFDNNSGYFLSRGLYTAWTNDGKILNSTFSSQTSHSEARGLQFGSGAFSSRVPTKDIILRSCQADNNEANVLAQDPILGTVTGYGFALNSTQGVRLFDCTANRNKCIFEEREEPPNARAIGYLVLGERFDNLNTSLNNCQGSENETIGSGGGAFGIQVASVRGIGVSGLRVNKGEYNDNISDEVGSGGFGIAVLAIDGASSGHVIKGVSVESNSLNGVEVIPGSDSLVFDSNYIIKNGGVGLNMSGDDSVIRNNILIKNNGNIVDTGVGNILVDNQLIV